MPAKIEEPGLEAARAHSVMYAAALSEARNSSRLASITRFICKVVQRRSIFLNITKHRVYPSATT